MGIRKHDENQTPSDHAKEFERTLRGLARTDKAVVDDAERARIRERDRRHAALKKRRAK